MALFSSFCKRLSTVSRSFSCNSVSIISLSRTGSTLPSTCTMLLSSKQRSTWIMASVSRMLDKNLLPSPSPLLAPFTKPAMSTISTTAGTTLAGLSISTSLFRRSSGTVITPTLGSIVQKGKFADCALALLKQLNSVDFPTFGKPTIPHCKPIILIQNLMRCKDNSSHRDMKTSLFKFITHIARFSALQIVQYVC